MSDQKNRSITHTSQEDVAPENNSIMLEALGQISIWSFHDIINLLAKIQGFGESLDDSIETISAMDGESRTSEVVQDIKTVQTKIVDNTRAILAIINRIRAVRGRAQHSARDYRLRDVLEELIHSTSFSRYHVAWTKSMLPEVTVNIDLTIFEHVWLHLWRLLAEWVDPGVTVRANLASRLEVGAKDTSTPFPDRIFLYLWLDPQEKPCTRFVPERLTFLQTTPRPDLGHVFAVTSLVARRSGIDLAVSQTNEGYPVFSLTICGGIEDSDLSMDDSSDLSSRQPETSSIEADDMEMSIGGKGEHDEPVILVVDDEQDLRYLLATKITRMGYKVFTAANNAEAKEILRTQPVRMVLSDLFLNQESGLNLLREVKTSRPDAAFVFMSGANEDDVPRTVLQILSKSANEFLHKPISTQTLKMTIEKYVR